MRPVVAVTLGALFWAVLFVVVGVFHQSKADTWVSFGGVSHHLSDGNYNERNGGLGIEHDLSKNWRLMAGMYKNSFRRDSLYVGGGYLPLRIGPVRLGAAGGMFSGYGENAVFAAMGAAMIESKRWGLNILYMPKYSGQGGLLAFQFKVKFQ